MRINNNVDLGKAFEILKRDLLDIEKQANQDKPTTLETGMKYAHAYGRLSAVVQYHICMNTDTSFVNLHNEMKATEHPEGYPEQPEKLLFNQLNY